MRLCVDCKRVNSLTKPLPFYVPRVGEILEEVGKSVFISKMDLSNRYYQVPMNPADIEKMVFVCSREKFEFLRMPFGLMNAPSVFKTLMAKVLVDCKDFARPYMDDIIIFSTDWESHKVHIRMVLQSIREAELTVNADMCCWLGRARDGLPWT